MTSSSSKHELLVNNSEFPVPLHQTETMEGLQDDVTSLGDGSLGCPSMVEVHQSTRSPQHSQCSPNPQGATPPPRYLRQRRESGSSQAGNSSSNPLGIRPATSVGYVPGDPDDDDIAPEGIQGEPPLQTTQQKLHSVLRESLINVVMILVIISVVVVQFTIINRITAAVVRTQSTLIAGDAQAQVKLWLAEKIAVVEHHAYMYRTGQANARNMVVHPKYDEMNATTLLPNPLALQQYECMTAAFLANDLDLSGLYNAFSNNQTWKVHQETVGTMATQLRYAGTVSATNSTPYFERYERQRSFATELENFTLAKHEVKHYHPTEQEWYQDASAMPFDTTTNTYPGLWQGPIFQGTGVGADTYGLEPVMTYLRKVLWKDTSKFSVFKLKILTTKINTMLQGLNIPGTGDIAIVNSNGDVAAYRTPATQVIPDPVDPTNADGATFAKVWDVNHFAGVTQSSLTEPIVPGAEKDLGQGVSLYTIDEVNLPGFRIAIYLNGEELVAEYNPLFNSILGLAILLIVLGFVAIVYSFFSVQQHMAEASSATLGRLLSDLLPGPIAGKVVNRVEWPITATYPSCSVLFSDIVNFTDRSARASDPIEIVVMLNFLVEQFDNLSTYHNVEKIKTIGDCYMAVSGAPGVSATHASDMLRFAFGMLDFIREYNDTTKNASDPVYFRVGVNSGPVIGAVIGARRFLFDVFGPTVNVASRVESASKPMAILCTSATRESVEAESTKLQRRLSTLVLNLNPAEEEFSFTNEQDVVAKGVKEPIRCYYVDPIANSLQ